MSLGLQMAGCHIGLGMDNDPLACQTHAHNFEGHCIRADIATVPDLETLLRSHGLEHVDVIIGGLPCQGFSRMGRGKIAQPAQ